MRRARLRAAALAVVVLAACEGGPAGESANPDGSALEGAKPTAEATAAPQPPPEPRRIPIQAAYGETTEHTLAGGECHVLELELEADRYVELEVEQLGIDVATELIPPGDGETVRFDGPVGGSRPEMGAFVSEVAGRYRLEVCPWDRTADPGPYRLRVERPRFPTERTRTLTEGFRSYSRGAQRAGERETREHFSRALELFREAGARHQEGWTLYKLGQGAEQVNDLAAAENWYRGSAGLHSELGDARQEALALICLGRTLHGQGRRGEALEVHRDSLQRAEEAGDAGLVSDALTNLAYTSEELGYALEAIELQQRRRDLARETGDSELEREALSRIAKIYLYSGRPDEAISRLQEVLDLARDRGHSASVPEALENLGSAYLEAQEPERALEPLQRALEVRRSQANREALARTLNNLGRCYRRLGEREKALRAFEEGLSVVGKAPRGSPLEALLHINLATIYVEEGDFETPAEHCRRAYSILRDYERPGFTTGALRCLARIHRSHGDLEGAAEYARRAVELVETFRTRSALGELRAHFLADQYAYYELYVDVLLRLEDRHPGAGYAQRAFQVAELSKGRTLLDNLRQAEDQIRRHADPGLAAEESELQRRMSSLERRLLRQRLQDGSKETAAALEERLRALREQHALVVGQILADSPGWSALLAAEPATLEEVRSELLAGGEIQLVSFLLGEERSYAWIVGRDSLDVAILPARERIESLGRQVARLLSGGDQPHLRVQFELASRQLSEELLEPLAPHWIARKLLLVKDGALHYVPFAALPIPGGEPGSERPLVADRYELVEVPSSSAAVALHRRQTDRPIPRREVAILADPVFELDDERLRLVRPPKVTQAHGPESSHEALLGRVRSAGLGELTRLAGSARESSFISALVAEGDLLVATGFEANRELLLHGGLGGFRILHLAGHGLAHSDLTGLVLSMYDVRGRPVDGLIQPYELYGLSLSADLVVLSACRTGLGQEIRGEGLMGLSRGFLHAGASQVLASLWDVDDAATAELMSRFYTAHLQEGEPPARALRTAQRSLRRSGKWAAPHYWAGFVLQGAGL